MVGQTISHYQILEKLGEGGMGVVYKARDTKLDRLVALKFLPPALAADATDKERFIQEARAASCLDHPNVCNVHEIGEAADGQLFIAMTLYDGVPLNKKIEQAPLPIEDALDVAIQAAEGLQAAHEKGIVHRDIKSSNIMVTGKGRSVIMDFGLARASGGTTLTWTGSTMGTVPYMSPEQARGEKVDHRTDIWSFGIVLHEMIAGRHPFRSDYEQALVYSILNEEPEPLTSLRSNVPMELERIVTKAMQKDRDLRYQTAGDLLADLKGLARGIESGARLHVPIRKRAARKPWLYLVGGTLALAAVAGIAALFFLPATPEVIDSIAVLPLNNLTGDPTQEYFVDGMHEALISELSKISALKVISRTSVMQYKGATKSSMREIARELGVNGLVEGSVLREGSQVRITVQLIHGPEDKHLWTETYERELRSVLALHSEVAQAIAAQVRVAITPQEQIRLGSAHAVNPQAYEAYLLGRHYWNQRSIHGFDQAVENFRKAVELDPDYGSAYAGLADAYMLLGEQGGLPQEEARLLGGTALQQALELDSTLAEAQSTLGHWKLHYEMNWAQAEQAFRQAIELNPGDAFALARYGRLLAFQGRFEEAISKLDRARELDPLSVLIGAYLGQTYLFARRYEEAHQQLQRVVVLDPNHTLIRHNLGELYLAQGRLPDAIRELERSVELSGQVTEVPSSHYLAILGFAYARTSRRNEAVGILDELTRRDRRNLVSAFDMAVLHMALGDKEQALNWLERGYEQRDVWFVELNVWPWFDPLRDDPRFQRILHQMGLSEGTRSNR
ncbi:MAG TPA: protein kinase [Rhodothermales bacterium]|nr:protein kinase [Rhodothermales bacterium]